MFDIIMPHWQICFKMRPRYNTVQYYMITNIEQFRQIQENCHTPLQRLLHKWLSRHLNHTASQLVQQSAHADIKAPHHWCFVKGIHQWPVASPHKGPVMQKGFKCHDVLMFETTKYNPYLTLVGEIQGVYFRHSVENLPCYKGTALYWHNYIWHNLLISIITIFDLIMLHISVSNTIASIISRLSIT